MACVLGGDAEGGGGPVAKQDGAGRWSRHRAARGRPDGGQAARQEGHKETLDQVLGQGGVHDGSA